MTGTWRLEPCNDAALGFCWELCCRTPGRWWFPTTGNVRAFAEELWTDVLDLRLIVDPDDVMQGLAVAYRFKLGARHGSAWRLSHARSSTATAPWGCVASFIDAVTARYPLRKLSFDLVDSALLDQVGHLPLALEGSLRAHVLVDREPVDLALAAIFTEDWHRFRRRERAGAPRERIERCIGIELSSGDWHRPLLALEGVDSLTIAALFEELGLDDGVDVSPGTTLADLERRSEGSSPPS